MDPLVFHTREIGSAHHKNRIHETVAHPKRDPIGSTAFHIFPLQEEKTFGLGMKDLAPPFAPVRRHHWRGRRSSKSHLRRPKDFPLEPHMSEAMCRSGERMRTRRTCRARFELGLANVMGGDSGVGRVRCGVRATVCYGRNFGRWAGPLWRSSYHMLWEEFGQLAGPAVALQLATLTLRWCSSSSSSLLIPPSSSHLVPPSSFLRLPCPPSSSLLPPPLLQQLIIIKVEYSSHQEILNLRPRIL